MAQSTQYQWLDYGKPTFPYKSYTSPVDETPHFIQGAQNILASQIGYCEKRPGFSTKLESVLSTIPGTIVRIFPWRRWGGSFFVMLSVIDSGVSKVYKYEIGADASFVLIWTSTSGVPFDFVVSNNFCYFGNATDMRKYQGTTVSKWGCDDSGFAPSIALITGSLPPGMSFAAGILSGTPTVQGTSLITLTATDTVGNVATKSFSFEVDPATVKITYPGFLPFPTGTGISQTITANYGTPAYVFSLFSGALPTGLSLAGTGVLSGTPTVTGTYNFAIKVTDSLGHTDVKAFSWYIYTGASPISVSSSGPTVSTLGGPLGPVTFTASGGTAPYTFSYISDPSNSNSTLPPGATFTPASPDVVVAGTPTSYGIFTPYITVSDSAGNSTVVSTTFAVNPTVLSFIDNTIPVAYQGFAYSHTFQLLAPGGGIAIVTFTFTAGSLNAQTGYVYGYTYTTIYGHESNMSPLSLNTGLFTGLDPNVTVIASADPQVNGINIYRTTDGGTADPAIMRLVVSLSNTNQTYQDSTLDVNLGLQTGPGFLINTPPTPCLGFTWSNGRIYGFTLNMTYYSGAEEVSNGIQEEAWPSGLDGNFYAWPSEVGGQATTQEGVDIGLSEQYWQVSGDTLDTFRKALLLDKAGVRSPTCISSIGDSVQWVDTAKQVWSSSLGEFGESIRTDLLDIDPTRTYIGYHKSGNFNWIYLLDANLGRLYTYDLDLDQWNTPWTVTASAIASGEISLGRIALMVAIDSHVMILTPGTYVDDGSVYEDDFKLGLMPISPGRTTTGRSRIEPTQIEEIDFEMNAVLGSMVLPSFVGQVGDNDPIIIDKTEWTELSGGTNPVPPEYIPVNSSLGVARYICDSNTNPAIRTAAWMQWAAANLGWKVYSFTIGWIKAQA